MNEVGQVIIKVIAVVLAIIFVPFVIGLLTRHVVRPVHNKIWGYKLPKKKGIKDLWLEGILLIIMVCWILLSALSIAVAFIFFVNSVKDGNILYSVLSLVVMIILLVYFWRMLEHKKRAKERRKKRLKKIKKRK